MKNIIFFSVMHCVVAVSAAEAFYNKSLGYHSIVASQSYQFFSSTDSSVIVYQSSPLKQIPQDLYNAVSQLDEINLQLQPSTYQPRVIDQPSLAPQSAPIAPPVGNYDVPPAYYGYVHNILVPKVAGNQVVESFDSSQDIFSYYRAHFDIIPTQFYPENEQDSSTDSELEEFVERKVQEVVKKSLASRARGVSKRYMNLPSCQEEALIKERLSDAWEKKCLKEKGIKVLDEMKECLTKKELSQSKIQTKKAKKKS